MECFGGNISKSDRYEFHITSNIDGTFLWEKAPPERIWYVFKSTSKCRPMAKSWEYGRSGVIYHNQFDSVDQAINHLHELLYAEAEREMVTVWPK